MLGVFSRFLRDFKRQYAPLHDEHDRLRDLFERLTNETGAAGIRISDMAIHIVRERRPVGERAYWCEKIADDLAQFGADGLVERYLSDNA